MRRSVVVVALFATACGFGSPRGKPTEPDADVVVDAPPDGPPVDTPDPTPWLTPWAHRKAITLRASQIEAPGDAALTGFPVLVSVTDAQIGAGAALATGQDIVFTADDATTRLASEIESFAAGTGELVAWVKVPSLSATTDTTLYVYYGNPSAAAQAPEDVWTASYLAVWHLHQDPGPGNNGDIRDATSGNHDGTASSNMDPADSVPARIGRGLQFDGNNELLSFGSMDFGNTFTISMWVAFAGTNSKALMANSGVGLDTDGFRFFVNTFNTTDRRIIFETGNGGGGSGRLAQTNTNAISANTPTHVAAVVDRAARTAQIFVDGVSAAASTPTADNFRSNGGFGIAQMNGALDFEGVLDEVRVAGTLRSPEWLLTSFRNQSQPGNFHSLGAEEQSP